MSSNKRFTLPRQFILKKKSDIEKVFQLGQKYSTPCLNIFVYPSKQTRVAFLVNKKVGKAYQRNRMKRLVREAYRLHQHHFRGKEVIFYIRKYVDDFHGIIEQIKTAC